MGILMAFTGHLKAGKSTSANFIEGASHFHLVDPMKKALLEMLVGLGLPRETVYRHIYIEKTEWSRKLMQAFGNYARSIDPDVFVRPLCDSINIEFWKHPDADMTVDDVRFKNEAEALRLMGFSICRIIRPGYEGDGDPTETEMDGIEANLEIQNDGNLDALHQAISAVVFGARNAEARK